jgi:hypothetical protein
MRIRVTNTTPHMLSRGGQFFPADSTKDVEVSELRYKEIKARVGLVVEILPDAPVEETKPKASSRAKAPKSEKPTEPPAEEKAPAPETAEVFEHQVPVRREDGKVYVKDEETGVEFESGEGHPDHHARADLLACLPAGDLLEFAKEVLGEDAPGVEPFDLKLSNEGIASAKWALAERIVLAEIEKASETKEPVYGATATVDGTDLVFDETHERWVVAETKEPWTGAEPKTDEEGDELPDLEAMTVSELREFAKNQDPPVDLAGAAKKAEIVAKIVAALG